MDWKALGSQKKMFKCGKFIHYIYIQIAFIIILVCLIELPVNL